MSKSEITTLLLFTGLIIFGLNACSRLTENPVDSLRKSITEGMKQDCFLDVQKHDFLTDIYRQRSDLGFLVGVENKRPAPTLPKEITLEDFIDLKPSLRRERTRIPTPITGGNVIYGSQQSSFEIWEYRFRNEEFSFLCRSKVDFDGDIPLPRALILEISRKKLN